MSDNRLKEIYFFLQQNHAWNKAIQIAEVRRILNSETHVKTRAKRLLFEAFLTQRNPKLEHVMCFSKFLLQIEPHLSSFKKFITFLELPIAAQPKEILRSLQEKSRFAGNPSGFGPKTISIFLRNLAIIQRTELKNMLWADIPLWGKMDFLVPVDRVIMQIFGKLRQANLIGRKYSGFDSINKCLKNSTPTGADMLIWDDLWFWGYITQNSRGGVRNHRWNEAKYWSIYTAKKASRTINKIKTQAQYFLSLIKSKNLTVIPRPPKRIAKHIG